MAKVPHGEETLPKI